MSRNLLWTTTSALALVAIFPGAEVIGQAPESRSSLQRQSLPIQYRKAIRVPAEAFEEQRTALLLPTEPGEYGEDQTRRTRGAVGDLPEEIPLLPEGYVVAAREARIEKSGDRFVVKLKDDPELPAARPLRILPNPRLEMIEAILRNGDQDRVLVVTGRVTEFQGHNYILLEVLAERLKETKEPAPRTDRSGDEDVTAEAAETPRDAAEQAPRAADPAESTVLQKEPSAESVLEELLEDRPLRTVVLPDQDATERETEAIDPVPLEPSTSEGDHAGPAWPDDTVLANRTGRILASDDGWTFAFENRGHQPDARPISVLPNRLLESAIAHSAGGSRSVVFLVTGEITVHRNQNYMLLRKVIIRRDLGNLR
jgi:hypothetical protein